MARLARQSRMVIGATAPLSLLIFIVSLIIGTRSILERELSTFRWRASTASVSVNGASSAVGMMQRQVRQSLEEALDEGPGYLGRISLDFRSAYDPERGFYDFIVDSGDANALCLGSPDGLPDNLRREINALFGISEMFCGLTASQRDFTWAYFLSKEDLIFVSPVIEELSAGALSRFHAAPVWTEARFIERTAVTEAYEDAGGKGLMISFIRPVTMDGEKAGVVGTDITLDRFNRSLGLGFSVGDSMIVDENGVLVTKLDSARTRFSPEGSEVLPGKGFRRRGTVFYAKESLLENELIMLHAVDGARIVADAMAVSFPLLILLMAMNALGVLFLQLRKSYSETSEERDFSKRLISIVGHDLQTPLSVIAQAASIVDSEEHHETIGLIQRSNSNAIDLLRNLTLWGKDRSKDLRINPKPYHIASLVEEIVEALKPNAEMKNIEFATEIGVGIMTIDKDFLQTVLRNLLSNALKFSPPGSSISLKAAEKDDRTIVFAVEDHGGGMSEEKVRRFLGRKTIASEKGTNGERGTGLGLFLVGSLCDEAGWDVSLSSKEGEGTEFTITVPADPGNEE